MHLARGKKKCARNGAKGRGRAVYVCLRRHAAGWERSGEQCFQALDWTCAFKTCRLYVYIMWLQLFGSLCNRSAFKHFLIHSFIISDFGWLLIFGPKWLALTPKE